MGRQRRPRDLQDARGETDSRVSAEAEGTARSNADVQTELVGSDVAGVNLPLVRDLAVPLLERASFALEIQQMDGTRANRYIDIIDRSHLPEWVRESLAHRLQSNQILADAIGNAVSQWFGVDDQSTRGKISDILHESWNILVDGVAGSDVWTTPDGRQIELPESVLVGGLEHRAGALIEVVSGEFPLLGGVEMGVGPAVVGFCRSVAIAAHLVDEDEQASVYYDGEGEPEDDDEG